MRFGTAMPSINAKTPTYETRGQFEVARLEFA